MSDISASKTIDLPVWLALRMNEFVRHEIPKQYRTRFQNILNADSEVVNLHKEGPRYYALGLQVKLRIKFLLENKISVEEKFFVFRIVLLDKR